MKNLKILQGGYPRQMDYTLTLQTEFMTVANSMFGKLGKDIVLSGCDVVNNGNGTLNISTGIVFVDAEVVRFDGANNVPADLTRTFVKDVPVSTDTKTFGDGIDKQIYTEVKAIIGNKVSVSQIAIGTELYTLATYIRDVSAGYAVKGEYKEIYDFDGTFLQNFDESGLGITTGYLNWALDNGNNGTPGSVGRVLIGTGVFNDPVTGLQTVYYNGERAGERTHKLSIGELPSHDHGYVQPKNSQNVDAGGNSRFGDTQSGASAKTGGDLAHNNMQPYLAVYRIIKLR